MNGPVIVVEGPTASGKTAFAITLAKRLGGEIVSADSMQIYRGMDVGTAKATPEERAAVPHHMLDVCDPGEDYSVSRYVRDASAVCDALLAAGRTPVIAGGTGLYIDSLLAGRDFAGTQTGDGALRSAIGGEFDRLGGEAMLEKLRAFDPERAARLHPGDRRRIIRAIEVYRLTGQTITEHDAQTRAVPPRYASVRFFLNFRDRAALYARIDGRVDAMVRDGLFGEVGALLSGGLSPDCTAMQAIGYKETAMALRGLVSLEEAVALIKQNSRRYAKRQITWFGRDALAHRILWDRDPDPEAAADGALARISGAFPEL